MKFTSILLAACGLFAGLAANVSAQDYPARPVSVLVGFPAGGSADIVGRIVMQKMAEITGNPFIVENRTGAGGNIAFSATANAKPDGYTILFSTPGAAINPSLYKKVSFKIEDFTPIALVADAPLLLVANAKLPIKSVKDLVEAGKVKPDAIRFASSGSGSSSHLAMDYMRHLSGLQYLHIPYRGGGAALIDLMSGQVDVTMLPISESMPYVRDGRAVALGQTGAKRSAIAPNIPTIEEAGVKGYSANTWYMVLGPANLPPAIVNYLQTHISRVLKMPDVQEKFQTAGVSIINGDSKEAAAFLMSEYRKWAAIIKASGTIIE